MHFSNQILKLPLRFTNGTSTRSRNFNTNVFLTAQTKQDQPNHVSKPKFLCSTFKNCFCRLDSIGIAGFGHDFKSIDGEQSPVMDAFGAFGGAGSGFVSRLTFALGAIFPQVVNLPIKRMRLFAKLNEVTTEIANELFENSRREKQGSDMKDRSIIGMLGKHIYALQPMLRL